MRQKPQKRSIKDRLFKAGPAIGAAIGGSMALRGGMKGGVKKTLKRTIGGMTSGAGVGWLPDIADEARKSVMNKTSAAAFWDELEKVAGKRGLWDNIHSKRRRIAAGSGERMRKPGSKGAPSERDLEKSRKAEKSKEKRAEVEYRGRTFPGYNKPIASDRKGKKKMVLVKRGDKVKLVHFGQKGYEDYTQHKDKKRRANYLKRSGGIKGKGGKLTKDDPFSPNYWSRRSLWPS